MDPQFWLQRWRDSRIGFHRDEPMPLLQEHWAALALPTGSRVLVPLAGKSKDMLWLAERGYRVLAVELSPLAVEQFFDENALQPTVHDSRVGKHFVAGDIEVVCGDLFHLQAEDLSDCAGVYDRAALIALPVLMRRRYAMHLSRNLPEDCRMLLITLDYAQSEMEGPPFSVTANEVDALYAADWHVTQRERRDILADQPNFAERGVSTLHTAVYVVERSRQDVPNAA